MHISPSLYKSLSNDRLTCVAIGISPAIRDVGNNPNDLFLWSVRPGSNLFISTTIISAAQGEKNEIKIKCFSESHHYLSKLMQSCSSPRF